MPYTLDTSHAATAFTRGRQGSGITTIVVHHWGDPATNPTFDGTVAFFARGGKNTSAHYVAEAGRVARMVADTDTAYHAGNWSMNLRSIGIECNPRASDADKATVAELIQDLRRAHGNLVIIGHRDVISTDCPGRYYPPNTVLAPWLNSSSGAGGIVSGGVHIPGAPTFPTITEPAPTQEDDDMDVYAFTTKTGTGFRLRTALGETDLGNMGEVDACMSAINARVSRVMGPNGWELHYPAPCLDTEAALLASKLATIRKA